MGLLERLGLRKAAPTDDAKGKIEELEEKVSSLEDRIPITQISLTAGEDGYEMPIKGGEKSSMTESQDMIGHALDSSLKPGFALEWLDAIQHLSAYNADVSFAVDNIRNLGNTRHTIAFGDGISETAAKEMHEFLTGSRNKWYSFSAGMTSLINDLLTQLAVSGAISQEMVPNSDLSNIDQIVPVPVRQIRFREIKKAPFYEVYQAVASNGQALISGVGEIKLSPRTYRYIAMMRYDNSPYAIPPMLSVLESVTIQRDQIESFRSILKKMGILGFLEVLMKAPAPQQGESAEKYKARCDNYLMQQIPQVQKGMAKGFVIGYEGQHTFKLNSANQNATGAETLYNMNEKNVMAGLKQDPAMLGRQFTTSETFGRVVLAKLTTQITTYQETVASFLEQVYLTALLLNGYNPGSVTVTFDKPMITDNLKDAQTRKQNLDVLLALKQEGIINRTQLAQEMGYDQPALDDEEQEAEVKKRSQVEEDPNDPDPTDTDEKTTGNSKFRNAKTVIQLGRLRLHADLPEFLYKDECCHSFDASDPGDPKLEAWVNKYLKAVGVEYTAAVREASSIIAEALMALPANATLREVQDTVIANLFKIWPDSFAKDIKPIAAQFAEDIYLYYRADAGVLAGVEPVPEVSLGLLDLRAIEYYKDSDILYLGKFITDKDTVAAINDFIKQEYLGKNTPIGNNTQAIRKFSKQFGDLLKGEDWKLRRVIDTTVNKMRNQAAVSYMNQAGVTEFEIRGIRDSLQCAYCAGLQGYRFSIEKEMNKFERVFNAGPASVASESPFISSVLKAEDLAGKTGKDLQKMGIGIPPYHPACRDIVIAVV